MLPCDAFNEVRRCPAGDVLGPMPGGVHAFGHGGARVLVFPTSMGRFYEWEDRGMMVALGEHVERGWIQLYCVDSVDEESWYAFWKHPGERAWRHMQYENYLLNEVLPLMAAKNPNPYLIVTGASFGAGVMYILDPEVGRRRRALLKDQFASLPNTAQQGASVTARDLRNRSFGFFSEARARLFDNKTSDEVLVDRVRSKLGFFVRHPSSIDIQAQDARIILSGPVLSDEVQELRLRNGVAVDPEGGQRDFLLVRARRIHRAIDARPHASHVLTWEIRRGGSDRAGPTRLQSRGMEPDAKADRGRRNV